MLTRLVLMEVALLSSFALMGEQPKDRQEEPQYNGVPSAIFEGVSVPLERQALRQVSHTKLGGIRGGNTLSYSVTGEKSEVRFPVGASLSFVIRIPDRDNNHNDPKDQIAINLLQNQKGSREYIIATAGSFGANVKLTDQRQKPLRFVPVGVSSFQFTPTEPLPPGHYVVTSKFSATAFLFDIVEGGTLVSTN